MGLKELWERYQVAAAFAEAGEHDMARKVLEEGGKKKRAVRDQAKVPRVHQGWKTRSAPGLGS